MTSRKNKRQKVSKQPKAKKPKVEKIHFVAWFSRQVLSGKLRLEQEEEILTFFKQKGLTEIEDPEKYDSIVKKY